MTNISTTSLSFRVLNPLSVEVGQIWRFNLKDKTNLSGDLALFGSVVMRIDEVVQQGPDYGLIGGTIGVMSRGLFIEGESPMHVVVHSFIITEGLCLDPPHRHHAIRFST